MTNRELQAVKISERTLNAVRRAGFNAEEPAGVLAGTPQKIQPFIPYYKANGNEVLEQWTEPFVDRAGNKALLTKVKYKHPKKTEVNETVIRVQWEN